MLEDRRFSVLLGFVLGVASTTMVVLLTTLTTITQEQLQEELQLECDLKDRDIIHLEEAILRLREKAARPRSQAITVTELKEGQYLLETQWDKYQITVERSKK